VGSLTRDQLHHIRELAVDFDSAAAWVRLWGEYCLTVTAPPPAVSVGPVRGGSSDHADPTANGTVGTVMANGWLQRQQAQLEQEIGQGIEAAVGLVGTIGRIKDRYPPAEKPADGTPDPEDLCRQGCGRAKTPGRQGNCSRCAQWLAGNPLGAGPRFDVPAGQLDEFKEKDRKQREAERKAALERALEEASAINEAQGEAFAEALDEAVEATRRGDAA
jgi:hypothetical protein